MKPLILTPSITKRDSKALRDYFSEVEKIPMISAEQEAELSVRIKSGDERAVDELVVANLRFAISVAKQYQGRGLPLEDLIAEADEALRERGVKFHYAVAGSDRETLYLFNRLVRDIDGFILFPDNRILSRSVLTEMMSYASRHRVQVAVFNEPLLDYGALFSAGVPETNVADQITVVLDKILSGDIEAVPAITPLTGIEIQANPEVVQRLGLDQPDGNLETRVAEAQ